MKKVNELNIKINRAVITGISIDLDLDSKTPIWTITGKLLTDKGMPISDFTFGNRSWMNDDRKIEISLDANMCGRELFEVFTPVVLEKLGNMFKSLPIPKE